ncbi:toxic anion resistance protein [Clostridium sp.]|uniref:toxic anion resistance protein n=1 Tax=Clostridium sp. TaxID=1506 RepID=UPI003463F216
MTNNENKDILSTGSNTSNVIPSLTLDPFAEVAPEVKQEPTPEVEPEILDDSSLTDEEKKMVSDFAEKIDITNTNMILQYGAASQKKIAGFSESTLSKVRTKDLGQVGDMITNLVGELKDFSTEEKPKGIFGIFKKAANNISNLKTKYDKAEVNVDKICNVLEGHQIQLLKDIAMLDEMYSINLVYFKELSMYILAGKKKLEEIRKIVLPELVAKANASNLPEDSQATNDMANLCDRFEKKIHDLELTRIISIQMAPQIRLVQNNDTLMAEKIQSTLVNTIPLWKSQMVIALGVAHSQQAMEAQREVANMTNELLRKNAETLKTATIETAKESERGIVDIETLKHTNQTLISTLDEVVKIQEQGRQKRQEAELEIGRIEGELKKKLLDIR